jgi:rhodanese-related sulfurtransferase
MITITSLELEKILSANSGLSLLDVRTPAEFDEGHIEGSINVPLDQLTPAYFLKNKQRFCERNFYLICQKGPRSQQAARLFDKEGLNGAIVVGGGLSAWIEAGFKIKTGKSKVIGLERQVRIAAGSLVILGVILAKFVHPDFIWLSAFVGAGLIFAGITDWCGMGMLLASLPWNQKVPEGK